MARYLVCLMVAVLGLYLIAFAAVESPDRFSYAAAAFVVCVTGMAIAMVSMVLSW